MAGSSDQIKAGYRAGYRVGQTTREGVSGVQINESAVLNKMAHAPNTPRRS